MNRYLLALHKKVWMVGTGLSLTILGPLSAGFSQSMEKVEDFTLTNFQDSTPFTLSSYSAYNCLVIIL
ncbi:MAG: hypothetical protein HC880_15230 [Bacteroidia bacterium]|nr:hypothetical protein [Bacteroidia bacterium]